MHYTRTAELFAVVTKLTAGTQVGTPRQRSPPVPSPSRLRTGREARGMLDVVGRDRLSARWMRVPPSNARTPGGRTQVRLGSHASIWSCLTSGRDSVCAAPSSISIVNPGTSNLMVPLRDRCSFGRFTWLISQALTVTYVVGEHRLYLERNCRLPESGPQETAESRGACQFQGAEQSARVRPSGRTSAKVEAAFHGFHGSSPCKCQRLSTLR